MKFPKLLLSFFLTAAAILVQTTGPVFADGTVASQSSLGRFDPISVKDTQSALAPDFSFQQLSHLSSRLNPNPAFSPVPTLPPVNLAAACASRGIGCSVNEDCCSKRCRSNGIGVRTCLGKKER
jgi:hypothetical protein